MSCAGCGGQNDLKRWFEAARCGNVQFITKNVKKYATETESRASDPDFGIYRGFSAIHYAIMSEQLASVSALIEHEYFCRLQCDALILAPSIGPRAFFILREGMNIQHIAFLVGNQEIQDYILSYQHKSGCSLVGIPDVLGTFSVEMLFLVQTTDTVIRQLHTKSMEDEIMYDSKKAKHKASHLYMASLFGRLRLFQHLISYIESGFADPQFVDRICHLALQTTGTQTILDVCGTQLEFKKCGVTPEERQQCCSAVQTLTNMALRYMEAHQSPQNQKLIDEFKRVSAADPQQLPRARSLRLVKSKLTSSMVGVVGSQVFNTNQLTALDCHSSQATEGRSMLRKVTGPSDDDENA